MDRSINPCDDFYDFACGKFKKETSSISLGSEINDLLQNQLKQLIEGPFHEGDPRTFKLAQSFYNVCLHSGTVIFSDLPI